MDQPNFEKNQPFEADVEHIGKEVRERTLSQESSKADSADAKEIIKEVTRPIIHSQRSDSASDDSAGILPAYTADFPKDSKDMAEALVRFAVEKGIYRAAQEAKKTGDAAVIDAFHDAITTKLYDEFKRRGIL